MKRKQELLNEVYHVMTECFLSCFLIRAELIAVCEDSVIGLTFDAVLYRKKVYKIHGISFCHKTVN